MLRTSEPACIVCGGQKRPGLSSWHASCPACAYESASLAPTINAHCAHAQLNERDREAGLKALRAQNFAAIAALAARHAAPGATLLLDVGCAHGWFLEAARARFTVLGVEPDTAIARRARAQGLPVRDGYFPDALQAGERFDVIVFNDVIEHIPDIDAALSACQSRLRDGGLLILNLPSSKGFFFRLSKLLARLGWRGPFERLWQKGLPSPHVHYFHAKNLSALVGRHGFTPVHQAELASLRAGGLLQRLRCVGQGRRRGLYLQYALILCTIPVSRLFPSDIVVCLFRKK
ncbi:class I SAM-dependent methyltransferase [Massilia glaciei]|uniref:Class I SAM-dependent methyltransferase n=1 Tax=Massilia glaciei TaxID=1524097 RepID=A0A2U2I732_9BURK|nr:class I SAM-dependent methyltransferase [Massilia glaciei]PWF55505.1 class I SAM-dependent methyltransferase [Massilia glaciei]